MKFLKLLLISAVVFFLLFTGIGLLFPSTVRVSRAADISANTDSIYTQIADLHNWKAWMEGADSNTIKITTAHSSGTGAQATIGTGKVEIEKATGDSIITVWTSQKGNAQKGVFVLYKNASPNSCTVQWTFEQQIGWLPWERFGSLSNDKVLGPVMEQSLDALKRKMERTGN